MSIPLKPLTLLIILMSLGFLGCSDQGASTPDKIYFSDLVEVNEIDSVRMDNVKGNHSLTNDQLDQFKIELAKMEFTPGSYKLGSYSFVVFMKGKSYHFYADSESNMLETDKSIVTKNESWLKDEYSLYFNTKGLNIHNF
ncbi:MAG: hypothetical protein H6599_01255 [Flavobacteriales bacterium]|nr:hypothetical protein [Flavobacteriales bacterium]